MKNFKLEYPPGATPLDPNEINGLMPDYISTQSELNLLEQQNILEAESWARGKKTENALTDHFIRELHKRMFNNVWRWAGQYRRTEKNIGITASSIPEELQKLCKDTQYWIENKTYPWDELGTRFHHRMVWIHAFSNGNGRHARLITDILLKVHRQEPFSWGLKRVSELGADSQSVRADYLTALRAADQKKFKLLIGFVKS